MAQELNIEKEPELDVVRIEEYIDRATGKHVTIFIPQLVNDDGQVFNKTSSIDSCEMKGTVHIMTPQGPMTARFDFPPNTTLVQAFAEFEDFAKTALAEHQKEENDKILVPGEDF